MTQKELLYVEDAIAHECIIIDLINDIMLSNCSDNILSFMEKEMNCHEQTKKILMKLLEAKQNE